MNLLLNYHDYNIYKNKPEEILSLAAKKLVTLSESNPGVPKHVSMFGGSTVFKLFSYLEEQKLLETLNWSDIHLWWGDERIVPFDSEQSNYGELKRKFLDRLPIPAENIHPLGGYDGAENPEKIEAEVVQIENLTKKLVPANKDGIPSFDLIYLGIGDDGHTASLFPGCYNAKDENLWFSTVQPETFQPRISKTIKLINAAKEICFVALGESKAKAVAQAVEMIFIKVSVDNIVSDLPVKVEDTVFASIFDMSNSLCSPVEYIGLHNKCDLLLDEDAASLIDFKSIMKRMDSIQL